LIGAVPGIDRAYVATGHNVWGMLNAPATGEAMSELIMDGAARQVDLAPFAPGRLPPLDPARLRGPSAINPFGIRTNIIQYAQHHKEARGRKHLRYRDFIRNPVGLHKSRIRSCCLLYAFFRGRRPATT